ncbi:hypothetical protein WAI453_008218 [Rhynchosporium graminicola]
MRTLKSASSNEDDRESAINDLEVIYASAPKTRAVYHYTCICRLIAIHSPQGVKERKAFAKKCLVEAKRKLYMVKLDAEGRIYKDEYSFTERPFKDLQKKAIATLKVLAAEAYHLRQENKLLARRHRRRERLAMS